MYAKLKYIILTLLLLGIGLGVFSYLKHEVHEYFGYYVFLPEFYLPVILAGLLILFFFLPRSLKMNSRLLTFSALGVSILLLLITLNFTLTHFSQVRYGKMMGEYSALNCEEMNNRFEQDLANNELKYFSFGLGGSGNLTNNLKKYNIQNYDLGCIIRNNLECYSNLVAEYLKEKANVEINELYD